jgi:hypothetical protein
MLVLILEVMEASPGVDKDGTNAIVWRWIHLGGFGFEASRQLLGIIAK